MPSKIIASLLLVFSLLFTVSGARAFEIVRVIPSPDSTIEETRPALLIYIKTGGQEQIDQKKLRLTINGNEASWKCLVMPNCITCNTEFRFPDGRNLIKFRYEGNGAPLDYEWSFVIKPGESISGVVTHDARDKLQESDVLTVTLKGPAGGRARFDIGTFKTGLPMEEISPGIYEGKYEVQKNDSAKEQDILVRLQAKDGDAHNYISESKVTIAAYFFKVRILSPKPDSEVDSYFDIVGRTRPHSKVSIAPNMVFTGGMGTNTSPGGLGAIEVMADEKGNFKVHYGFPIKVHGMNYRFVVTAWDADDNKSFPVSFFVKVK
jgi:hypothetical protein